MADYVYDLDSSTAKPSKGETSTWVLMFLLSFAASIAAAEVVRSRSLRDVTINVDGVPQ